jgi:hypothetical protein
MIRFDTPLGRAILRGAYTAVGTGLLSFATSILADTSVQKAAALGVVMALGALGFRTTEGAVDQRSTEQRAADRSRGLKEGK